MHCNTVLSLSIASNRIALQHTSITMHFVLYCTDYIKLYYIIKTSTLSSHTVGFIIPKSIPFIILIYFFGLNCVNVLQCLLYRSCHLFSVHSIGTNFNSLKRIHIWHQYLLAQDLWWSVWVHESSRTDSDGAFLVSNFGVD